MLHPHPSREVKTFVKRCCNVGTEMPGQRRPQTPIFMNNTLQTDLIGTNVNFRQIGGSHDLSGKIRAVWVGAHGSLVFLIQTSRYFYECSHEKYIVTPIND
jgi:hypothetical protein